MRNIAILLIVFAMLLPCLSACSGSENIGYPWEDPALSEEDASARYIADRIIMSKYNISAKQMTSYYDISVTTDRNGNTVVYYALTYFGYLTDESYTVILNPDGDPLEITGEFGEYACFFSTITEKALRDAENKLKEFGKDCEEGFYFLDIDDEGYLCLCAEFYKVIDPPNVTEDGVSEGCGIDHEHLFFEERICKRPE